jgi:hypothetical protein
MRRLAGGSHTFAAQRWSYGEPGAHGSSHAAPSGGGGESHLLRSPRVRVFALLIRFEIEILSFLSVILSIRGQIHSQIDLLC